MNRRSDDTCPDPLAHLPGPGGCCVTRAHLPGRGCPLPGAFNADPDALPELTQPKPAAVTYPNTVSDNAAALERERVRDPDRPRPVTG